MFPGLSQGAIQEIRLEYENEEILQRIEESERIDAFMREFTLIIQYVHILAKTIIGTLLKLNIWYFVMSGQNEMN